MASDTAKVLMVFTVIIVAGTLMVFSYTDSVARKQLDLKNQLCIRLADELVEYNKTCECYYGNCNAETQKVQDATMSYCICNCIENDTPVSICIRQTI